MRLLITWGVALATLVHADDEVVRVVRGVAPSLATKYAGQDAFTCLDATRTIPIGQVNDDYCDCADGSDEPGACPAQ
jgi:protein kinase C substrate 80K-H